MRDFDALMDDATEELVNGTPERAADAIEEIAMQMKVAGYPMQGFISVRSHIVKEAERRTDSAFINEKLKAAEKALQLKRAFAH